MAPGVRRPRAPRRASTYCRKKQARLNYEERHALGMGDQYVFVGIDAEAKLIPHFDVGKRNMVTAHCFMEVLKGRLAAGRFQLTTDAFAPYLGAVDEAWGADAPFRPAHQASSTGTRTRTSSRPATSSVRTSRCGWPAAASRG
jgi:hypothetical protein